MHSDDIWNNLELQRNRWKQCKSKAYIHVVFETIWNCRTNMKTWKQGRLRVQYDMLWYDILTCRENFESNVQMFNFLMLDDFWWMLYAFLSNWPSLFIWVYIYSFSPSIRVLQLVYFDCKWVNLSLYFYMYWVRVLGTCYSVT